MNYEAFRRINPHLSDKQMVEVLLQDRADFVDALLVQVPQGQEITAREYRISLGMLLSVVAEFIYRSNPRSGIHAWGFIYVIITSLLDLDAGSNKTIFQPPDQDGGRPPRSECLKIEHEMLCCVVERIYGKRTLSKNNRRRF